MNRRTPLTVGIALSVWMAATCTAAAAAVLPDRTFAAESVRKFAVHRVYAIAQDRQGFLWLGSETGVYRFDGARFDPMSPRGKGAIAHLAISEADRVFVVLRVEAKDAVVEVRDGELLVIPELGATVGRAIYDLRFDANGRLRITSEAGVFTWNPSQHGPSLTREAVDKASRDSFGMAVDTRGRRWRVAKDGMIFRDGVETAKASVTSGRTPWGAIKPYHDGVLVASDGGIRYHDEAGVSQLLLPGLPREVSVNTVFEDRNGDLWIGTDFDGLFQIDINPLLRFIDSPDGTPTGAAFGIAQAPDNSIWWTHNGGLGHVTAGQVEFVAFAPEFDMYSLRSLAVDAQGDVWVVNGDNGVFRLHNGVLGPENLAARFETEAHSALFSTQLGRMLLGRKGGGLAEWKGNRFVAIEGSQSACPDAIVSLSEPQPDLFWFATASAGLCRYDGKHWQRFTTADGLPENELRAIHVDGNDVVWIGGNHLGLVRFAKGRFVRVPLDLGLNHEEIASIVEDLEGYLWLGTPVGLFRINKVDANAVASGQRKYVRTRSFTVEDGLRARVFLTQFSRSGLRDGAGKLWFPNLRGLVQVDPQQLRTQPLPAPVIERVLINGQTQTDESTGVVRGSGNVIVRFLAPDLRNAHRLRFFHRLEGFDSDWRDSGVAREVSYANLPAGSYVFTVSVGVADRDERRESRVRFVLVPPWYRTIWFYGAVGAFVLLAFFTGHRLRLMNLRLRFDIINDERARVARDLHDTLEQSLVGLKLQIESLGRAADDPPRIRSGLDRARDLVGQAMRDMKGSIWALRLGATGNLDLATAISVMAGQALRGTELRFSLESLGTPCRLEPEAEQQLLRVLQEGLTNTVKYANAQEVKVLLDFGGAGLRVVFGDDGRGFGSEAGQGPSEGHFGLTGMRERAVVLGATIDIRGKVGHGTQITLTLPERWRRKPGRSTETESS
ncbi:MAG: two-component regulator propeller domain-containing protein [Deltaproteobacteria bacterium]|nr:two-component regulator propeller domain-containing protein [Deltaproteobacteria bacterium]